VFRQKLVETELGPARGEFLEHVDEIGVGIHAMQGAGSEKAIENRGPFGAGVRAGEQVVLSSDGQAPNLEFAEIVVCALSRRVDPPGESPGRRAVVPAGSTQSGSGGDE
jgi:hypothetical protein